MEECWQQPYREFQYIAMDYLDKKKKELRPEDFFKAKGIGSNQIMVGQYRSVGPIIIQKPRISCAPMGLDEDFWLRRIAIDHQLMRKELNTNPS